MIKNNTDTRIAEEMLLSSLLYKPDKIIEVIDEINPDVFLVKEFSRIYKCLVELYKKDVIPDTATILNEAKILGYDITPELVKKLSNSRTFVAKRQLKQYCEIIKNSSFKRKTIELCSDYLEKAKDIDNPEVIINQFTGLTMNLSDIIKPKNNESPIKIDSSKIIEDIKYRYNNPNVISGIPFGYPTVDKYLDGACAGEVITIGGQNSHGKSYFSQMSLINMALWALKNNIKKKIIFISLEMTREQIQNRLISIITGINSKYLKNPKLYFIDKSVPDTKENFDKFLNNIKRATEFLNKLPVIIDDSSVLSAQEIATKIKKHTLKDGVLTVFIDYVGLVQNKEHEEYLNIAQTYKVMKQVAKDTQIPIIILNQYLKDFKGREKTGYKPNFMDLAGGKSALNDSHKIIHVWKPDKYADFVEKHPEYIGKIVVFSDKNRDAMYGDLDEVLLSFDNGQLKETSQIRQEIKNVASEVFAEVKGD